GLIALLESTPSGTSTPLGIGFQPRYSLPISLSSTGAMALLAPAVQPGTSWPARDLEVEWFGQPSLSDTVVALVRLEQLSEGCARFAFGVPRLTGSTLYKGVRRRAGVRDGSPVVFRSRAGYEMVRAGMDRRRYAPLDSRLFRSIDAPNSIPLGRSASIAV